MSNASDIERKSRSESQPSTTEQVAERTHAAVDRVADGLDKREAALRATVAEVDEKIRDLGAKAETSTEQVVVDLRAYVREHPFVSAGIAFAAGVILPSLLRR